MTIFHPEHNIILDEIIDHLKEGGIIGLPTETVYGLAGDARNPSAIQKIYALKNRPHNVPLIVHVPSYDAMKEWAFDIPSYVKILVEHLTPGPLTFLLKSKNTKAPVAYNKERIGLRIPNHPLTLKLLRESNMALAAPSANKYNYISPTSPYHVHDEFGSALPFILDGGTCEKGIESTIILCSTTEIEILRPGFITAQDIKQLIPNIVVKHTHSSHVKTPLTSGQALRHYAPHAKTQIVSTHILHEKISHSYLSSDTAIIGFSKKPETFNGLWLEALRDPDYYARHLYYWLRKVDAHTMRTLYVEELPAGERWRAVLDRLERACVSEIKDEKTKHELV